jgi:hypothetical protein
MKSLIHSNYKHSKETLVGIIDNFANEGEIFVKGKRNTIKLVPLDSIVLNIKAFKIPNPINAFVYRFFRKSKARRSFEYANFLLQNGIGTPSPVAYFEKFNALGLERSYYISEHLDTDLTFRDLTINPDYPDCENILRQFVRFTYALHQKGIEFKDHSPGNTLIKNVGSSVYEFFLVDLNRMDFHTYMSLDLRMKNLSRLTSNKAFLDIMSNEYAKISGQNEAAISAALHKFTEAFHKSFYRKKRLKNKLRFGANNK